MGYGYEGKILRVNLSTGTISREEPEDDFYRRYLGGTALIGYYLLRELKPGIDPLGPDNKLVFATGVVTGVPVGGTGRNSVGAKSPLTGAYGDAQAGGYWGVELKHAGYDAIIVEGKAEKPVYLWIKDDQVEIRDADHLWGKTIGESQRIIRQELGDQLVRTAQIGPAGENLVRYACIINDLRHAAGRTGMGAVMGSKNLKAIALRGHSLTSVADPGLVSELAKWLRDNFRSLVWHLYDQGTPGVVFGLNRSGALPTRNFRESVFEGVGGINGRVLRDRLLVARRSCWACPIRCKRDVAVKGCYNVDPMYGGPEYETIAALGSNCGVEDLDAIAKGNELCNAYGLDTISTGVCVAFAMECFEEGILTLKDTDGIDLRFGNAAAMVQLVEMIARRQGLGDLLAEGVARAAPKIGRGAEDFALHVKGQELPMHEPRFKQGMALGLMVSPTGADHCHNLHDDVYDRPGPGLEDLKGMGILEPLPVADLSPRKVRMLLYMQYWRHLINSMVFCQLVPFNLDQLADLVRGVTGWNTNVWELVKVGERCLTMARVFDVREGFTEEHDAIPRRFLSSLPTGPLQGIAIDREKLHEAREIYYSMMGWEGTRASPSVARLRELDISWAERLSS